uniref:Uncharacterized protein n=1 Tax=Panagrolaimus sp. ES5 TaxID=591445 RepID=A0AC34GIC7_9BILA
VVGHFEELYLQDDNRSETLNSLKLYPDTEPMEAAVEKRLYDFIWPLICKAIRKAAQELYLNCDIFGTEKSDWITLDAELLYFRSLMDNDDDDDLSLASSDEDDDDDESMNEFLLQQSNHQQQQQIQQQQQQRQPPDLEALAQERIDEVSEEEY